MKSHLLIPLLSILSLFISSDEREKITWTNFQGQGIENYYGVGSKTYFYEGGKLVKLEYRDKEGKLIPKGQFLSFYPAVFRYTYDPQGNYVSREAYDSSGELMDLDGYYDASISRFKYNSQNQLIERQTLDKDEKLLEMGDSKIAVKKYEYDDSGHLITVTNYDAAGNALPGMIKFSYSPNGVLIKEEHLNLSDEVRTEFTFSYDDFGFLDRFDAYEQVSPEDSNTYVFNFSYTDSILTSINIHSSQPNSNRTEERGVKIGLSGWFIEDSLLLRTRFQHYGKGEFLLTIGPDGKVLDLEPTEVSTSMEFIQEVYGLFRGIKLKRSTQTTTPDSTGKIVVSVLEPFPTLEFLEFVKKPKPND